MIPVECPICGKIVPPSEGGKCIECGNTNICNDCLDIDLRGKYICKNCIKENEMDCVLCGKIAYHYCNVWYEREISGNDNELCHYRVCWEHRSSFYKFAKQRSSANSSLSYTEYLRFECPLCGEICGNCATEKRKFLRKRYFCPICGSELESSKEIEYN